VLTRQTKPLSARNPSAARQQAVVSLAVEALLVAARLAAVAALERQTTTPLPRRSAPATQTLEVDCSVRASRRRALALQQQVVEVYSEAATPAAASVPPTQTPQQAVSVPALALVLVEATTHPRTTVPPALRSRHSKRRTVPAMRSRSTRPSPSSNRTPTTPSKSCG
jgi:hypothetical protein